MSRIWRVLLSRRIAVAAMCATALLLALASLAPEAGEAALRDARASRPVVTWILERLDPGRFTRSPLFLALPGYIGIAVGASMWQRLRAWRRRGTRDGGALERFVERRSVLLDGSQEEARARVGDAIRVAGMPRPRSPDALWGSSGDAGFLGSMLFHAGLLVTMGAIAASAVGRFNGAILLVEGMPGALAPSATSRHDPLRVLDDLRGTSVTATNVTADYAPTLEGRELHGERLVDVAAILEVTRADGRHSRAVTSVNAPAEVGGFQLTIHRYGFAPEIEAVDPSGRVRAAGEAVLALLPPGTEDVVKLEGGGELAIRLFPDVVREGGRVSSPTAQPLHPALGVRWIEDGREVSRGLVEIGQSVTASGYRVAFNALPQWVDLVVARDPGLPWFAVGTALGILGLALRFLFHERSWRASFQRDEGGTRVELSLSSRYFPALLSERADRAAAALTSARRAA